MSMLGSPAVMALNTVHSSQYQVQLRALLHRQIVDTIISRVVNHQIAHVSQGTR